MRLRKSAIAEQDLFAIWDYIAQDSPTAADRFLRRLADRFKSLRKTPLSGESQDCFEQDFARLWKATTSSSTNQGRTKF